jgi:hypothetical protein
VDLVVGMPDPMSPDYMETPMRCWGGVARRDEGMWRPRGESSHW